jgi:spermidine synthase
MRSFGLIFGNTTYAITVILATYMGGIALGSVLIGRVKIKNPLRTYALVEIFIGGTAILAFILLQFLPGVWGSFLRTTPLKPILEIPLRILFSGLVILLPTLLMGATVPLLVEVLSNQTSRYAVLSKLYRMNTLGGVIGVLLTTYILFPMLGLSKTYGIAVIINLIICLICAFGSRIQNQVVKQSEKPDISPSENSIGLDKNVSWIFISIATIVGATSFSLEILWSRSFALVIGSSIYSFNLMLVSFLVGLVLGTWIYERVWLRLKNPGFLLMILLLSLCAGILLCTIAIGRLPLLYFSLMKIFPMSFGIHQVIEFFLCFIVMVPLTTVFGFVFPLLLHLAQGKMHEQENSRKSSARLYAWNTFGTLLGALATGFILVPFLGLQKSYVCSIALPLLMGIILLGMVLRWGIVLRGVASVIATICLVIVGIFWNPWDPQIVTSGLYLYGYSIKENKSQADNIMDYFRSSRRVIFYREGIEGVVSVKQRMDQEKYLSVNGKVDASTGRDMITQKLLAHIPMITHPNPKKVMIVGWGSGCTAGAASLYPLETLDVVEIEPAVFETNLFFAEVNQRVYNDPRFHMIYKDGRNVLLTTPFHYDVIISEPSNPWITGVSNLFTREFYEIGLSRLNKNGIFCQWFHIYNMPYKVLQSQLKTFSTVFPEVILWVVPPYYKDSASAATQGGDIILLGSRDKIILDMVKIQSLFAKPGPGEDLRSYGVENSLSFVSNAILDKQALMRLSNNAPLNTDDYPYIEFNAPQGMFHKNKQMPEELNLLYDSLEYYSTDLIQPLTNERAFDNPLNEKKLALFYDSLGNIYMKNFMMKKAEQLLSTSYTLDTGSLECAKSMIILNMSNSRFSEAIYWCKKAISINPGFFPPWDVLGSIYLNSSNFDEAKKVYQQVIVLFPKEAKGYFSLARILYNEKNFKGAYILLKKSLKYDPDNKTTLEVLKSIEQYKP